TMPRLLAAPVRGASIIGGKALTGLFTGISSLAVMFVVFGLLLDIDWGDPLTLAVLSVCTVLSVMGITSVVQSFARTQEQADAYSTIVGVLLALIGGSFFPIFQMPELIQRISVIAPNAWALRGFNDIVYDGATLGDLGPNLAVILAFAVVTGGISILRAGRLASR
ncbi:MAG: ABC transporter permease, partial [bacterium]